MIEESEEELSIAKKKKYKTNHIIKIFHIWVLDLLWLVSQVESGIKCAEWYIYIAKKKKINDFA